MTDKELLELAAKAAGVEVQHYINGVPIIKHPVYDSLPWQEWNPLSDDGDALRLAVKLELHVFGSRIGCNVNDDCFIDAADYGSDPYAATRRAIVRAAAEIGKEKGK